MKLSFILLCYNEEHEITKAIKSILYSNIPINEYEIIVVDDGSTDSSIENIKHLGVDLYYTSEDRKNMRSRGIGRNIGIRECKGEYVIFLDGSDYYDSTALYNSYIEFSNNYGFDVYSNPYYYQDEKNLYVKKQNIVNIICKDNPMSYIIKKEYITNNNLWFDEGEYGFYHEDLYFALKIYEKTNSIYRIESKPFIVHHKELKKSFYFNDLYVEIIPKMIQELRTISTKKYILEKLDMEEQVYIGHYFNYLKYKAGKLNKEDDRYV